MFNRKVEYKVVEVPQPRLHAPAEGQELRDGLRALNANPFFRFLVDRLRLQQAVLEGRLKATRFSKVEDAAFVQAGIFWTEWLQTEVSRLTTAPAPPELPPFEVERQAFSEIDRLLARVGIESPTSDER